MISYILLIISIVIVIFLYLRLLLLHIYNKKYIKDYTGFDICKEVTSNYDSINIVNSNDILLSEYDINRNVIRLNNKNYDGNSYIDIAIASILAGYSLVNNDNKNLFKFKFLIKKIRYYNILLLIMLVMSCFIYNIGDAKIGLILFSCFLIYFYMRYQIVVIATEFIKNNVNKDIFSKIENILVFNVNFNKLSFITGLIILFRLIVIILEI